MSEFAQKVFIATAGLGLAGAAYYGTEAAISYQQYNEAEQVKATQSGPTEAWEESRNDSIEASKQMVVSSAESIALLGTVAVSVAGKAFFHERSIRRPARPRYNPTRNKLDLGNI